MQTELLPSEPMVFGPGGLATNGGAPPSGSKFIWHAK